MSNKGIVSLAAIAAFVAGLSLGDRAAQAQEVEVYTTPVPLAPLTIPDRVDQAFYSNDRDFYRNRSIPRQVSYMFGPGILIRNSFPESEIARDGRAVSELYTDLLAQQRLTNPTIRTPDLPNPFNQSLLTLPALEASRPALVQPVFEPVPPAVRPQPTGPVPALW